MDALTERAMTAAVEVAAGLGVRGARPVLLRDGSNVLVHLAPSPVVARVMTTTGWLRQPAEVWLQRDLEVAGYLHSVGAAVVPPSAELPPGPHVWTSKDGEERLTLSFWTFVEHEREPEVTPEEAVASLRELHLALRGFPGSSMAALPFMGVVLDELPHWMKWLEVRRRLSGSDLISLRESHWKLAQLLRPGAQAGVKLATQALHGDAHRRNLLRTPGGLVWTDFEDTCKGPVVWDIATCLHLESGREEELLALYPEAPSWNDLQPYLEARDLEGVIYLQVLATRFPERAAEALRRLETWQRKRLG
jgi:hypothetical protein